MRNGGGDNAGRKRLEIVAYDDAWPRRFSGLADQLRMRLGDGALRIDHIGSTSVPDLDAKDVIDVQVTVERLADADSWPHELLPGLVRRATDRDHVPPGASDDPGEWSKRLWSERQSVHLHVREARRANQRYALLFRDYLRADRRAAAAYAAVKRALAAAAPDDVDTYYAVKDPACDLIIAGAEQWAERTGWTL